MNSRDSLTRLYSDNLQWNVARFGRRKYILLHWSLLYSLILLYQFTPLQIEWIGLIVIGLYTVIATLIIIHRDKLQGTAQG